jgi:23S rRNA (guanosine2251-2'-O)-methyltransferase
MHSKNNTIYIYGKHSVIEALNNPRRHCIILYCTKNSVDEFKEVLNKPQILKKNINLKIVDRNFIDKLIGDEKIHQGVCLLAKRLEEITIQDFLKQIDNKEKSLIALLDEIMDPQNVGAILRNAVAFGLDAVITTKHNSPEESSTIAKTASGALELIPLITITNLAQTMELLKKKDFTCYGMTLNHPHKELIHEVKFNKKSAIILGAEHSGLRRLTTDRLDKAIYIPIQKIDSLNVSSSSAIAFFYGSKNIAV